MGSGIDRLSQLVGNPAAGVQPTTPKIEDPKLSGVDRLSQLVRQNAPAITPTSVKAEDPTVAPTPAKTPSLADATNLQETRDALERQYNDALAANGGQPSTQSDALMKQMLNLDKWIDQQHSSGGYEDNVVNTVRGGLEGSAGGFVGAARFFHDAQGQVYAGQQRNIAQYLEDTGSPGAEFMRANANQFLADRANETAKLAATSDRLADQSAQHIEQAKEGLGTVGRTLVDVGVAGTQMLGDAAGNLIMPGGGLALMGIRSFGSASEDARRKGADLGRQFAYALPVAATEVLTEKMFDGLSGIFGKGAADDAVDALISKLAKTQAGQNALRALANMGGEALEEAVSGLVDPMLQNIIDDRQGEGFFRNLTPEAFADLGYSALVGGILGGLGGSVDVMKNPDLNAKIAAEQAAENSTPAQTQNVTAQALGASQATQNTTPAENAVQRDAGPSNATQPTDALAQVILDIQRSGAEKATKAQVEAVMNDEASMQRLGVEPATAANGKTASQVRGEVRDALLDVIVGLDNNAITHSDVTPGGTGAAAAGFNQQAGPQVQTQNKTVTEGVAYSDGQKRMVAPGTHERISEGESMARAADGFYVDSDGNVDIDRSAQDLLEDDHWTGVMNDRAMLLQQMAIQRATETGRGWNLVRKLAAKIEKMGTIAGQSLQARKKWIADSGDNIVTAAASLLEQAGDKMQDGELRRGVNADEVLSDIAVLASQYQNAVETGNTAALIDIIRRTAQQRHTTGLFRGDLSRSMNKALDYVVKQGDIDFLQRFAANGIYAIASDSMKTDAGTAIVSARRMAMLSKAATILRNLIGNGTFDIADTTSNNISVPLDVLLSAFTGTRSVAGEAYMSKAKIDGSLDGFWKSLLEVGLDVDTDGGMGKYETGGKRTFRMASPTARLLSTMEKWQGYAMTTTDEIAKGGIRAETQRGIDRLTARGRVKDDSLVDAAQQTALRRTFQDDTAASRLTLGARRALNNLHLGKVGAGDIAIPFAQVPANLTARAVDYSPIGLARGIVETVRVLKAAHDGTLTAAQQREAVLDLGAGINGTALIAGAAALALKGVLKVKGVLGGDDDKEALEAQGGQSGTQLNVDAVLRWANGEDTDWRDGDTLVSIGFLDPINAMLSTGALIAADATDEDGANVGSILKDSLNGTLTSVMELPVMETLRDFVENMRYSKETAEGGKFVDALEQFLADQVTSLIPNAVKGIAQGRDEYQRNAYTKKDLAGQTLDAIKASIPGLRETLPVKQDSYGRDMMTEEDPLLRALNANIMPGKITTMREDALTTELDRLNEKTGEAGFYPNRKPPTSISVDGEKTELTMEQQRKYQAEAGGMQLATGTAVMGLTTYRNAAPGVQAEIMDNVRDYARQLAKSRVVGADTDKWVSNAQRAQRDLHMSTAEWLAQYTILGGSEGLFGSSQYPKTLTMLNDGGLTLKEWGNMSRWLGDNGTGSNGAVVKEDVVDYITAHFDADDRAQVFDAYKGSRTWKNPF